MKNIVRLICFITLFFLVISVGMYLIITKHYDTEYGMRSVVMNRILMDVEEVIDTNVLDGSEKDSSLAMSQSESFQSIFQNNDFNSYVDLESYKKIYEKEYEKKAVPDSVEFISLQEAGYSGDNSTDSTLEEEASAFEKSVSVESVSEKSASVESVSEKTVSELAVDGNSDVDGLEFIRPVYSSDGTLMGFLKFIYSSGNQRFTIEMVGVILLISYFVLLVIIMLGYYIMIKPFNSLSEYPERLAKGRMGEGIPESKSRIFGKYIWGMNMLKDEISLKDKNLSAMEKEKQTLIVSIAHGIKTPLSNIKLYAEAIERGIYHEDKKPHERDAETAAKISQNVEKVEALVREIMDSSSKAEVDYRPVVSSFYLKDVLDIVAQDFTGRMEMLHIPFDMKCENNPLVTSDKDGIMRIVSQLLENAIKYGSGQGISLTMGRQDEDVIISVKNRGEVLSEEETAYVFKSFWRGSNAKNVEGQGIGLYVSKRIAESLGGDIFMKSWESDGVMEVTLILPVEA